MRKSILLLLASFMLIWGCKKNSDSETTTGSLPTKIIVDIPTAINANVATTKSAIQKDSIKGNDAYNQLRAFIWIGDKSAQVIQGIITALNKYGLNKPMDFTYAGDDSRTKHCVIVENATYLGKQYALKLTITDSTNIGMQIYWNTSPVEGIAILNPHYIDMNKNIISGPLYKIEYGENTIAGYEKHMIVSITGWPVVGVFGLNNLKMFVGKKGNLVDIYGNSNHPNAILFDVTNKDGLSYSFTSRADLTNNIAVVNLALPKTSLNTVNNIFTQYSITEEFRSELHKVYDPYFVGANAQDILNTKIEEALVSAQIPAYFNKDGYVSCGTTLPQGFTAEFTNLTGLSPFVPYDVSTMKIEFGK